MVLEPLGLRRPEDCSLSSMPASSKELWSWWHWCLNFTSPKSPVCSTLKKKTPMPMIESRTSHTTKNTTKIRSQQASEARFLSLPHKAPYLSTSAHKICSPAAHRPCRPCPDPVSYRRSSPGELGKRNEDRGWVNLVFLFCEEKGRTSTSTCFLTMWTMWWSEYFSMQKKHGSQRGQENLTHTHVFCRSKNSRKHISQENRSPGKVRTQKLCQSGTALRPNGQMAAATPA